MAALRMTTAEIGLRKAARDAATPQEGGRSLRRGGGDAGGGDGLAAAFDYAVGDFGQALFENQAERAPASIIGRGHEMHAVGMQGEVVTFFE